MKNSAVSLNSSQGGKPGEAANYEKITSSLPEPLAELCNTGLPKLNQSLELGLDIEALIPEKKVEDAVQQEVEDPEIDTMSKKTLLIIAVILVLMCTAVICTAGRTYTAVLPFYLDAESVDELTVGIEQEALSVEVTDLRLENGRLSVSVLAHEPGRAFVEVYEHGNAVWMSRFIVHRFGFVTQGSYFGNCRGAVVIPAAASFFIALLLLTCVRRYREGMRETLYQYRNVKNLSLIIYFGFLLAGQLLFMFRTGGLDEAASNLLGASKILAMVALPVAVPVSLLVTASNIRLMKLEGRSWRNMLACILGILICLGSLFPAALGEYLQRADFVDVHNQSGWALYAEMAVENTITVIVTYLECVLLGTIILSLKAARAVPAFDKDYILILGCKVKSDGTLTNLLKGRADRALEFAGMQKKATGKDICFVPSGGQGRDEVISEGEAIRNYLLGEGVPEERILTEDRSSNTEENFRNSLELIRRRSGGAEAKVAFSTTNYHVFRSGIIAYSQGVRAEGIGSRTRSYFWINAFVREFIATLHSGRRTHLGVIAVMIAVMLAMIVIVLFSNVL